MLGRRNPVVRALIANPKRNAGKHKQKRNRHMENDLDELESIADKHDLLLSDNLINFASDVWALAYKQGMQDEALAREYNKTQGEDK